MTDTADPEMYSEFTYETRRKKQRVPPGQRRVEKYPVLSIDQTPKFDPKKPVWDIEVTGAVDHPKKWNWQEFLKLPKTMVKTDIHCVTGWSKLDMNWAGVSFKTIIDLVGPRSDVIAVTSYGNEFYTSSALLQDMRDPDVLLAYELEGEALNSEHGGPLRLLLPKIYFYKSTKWLRKLEFTASWERGFWEVRGYHQRADPWQEERYASQERPKRAQIQKEFKKLWKNDES